jgi:hypothetical protein
MSVRLLLRQQQRLHVHVVFRVGRRPACPAGITLRDGKSHRNNRAAGPGLTRPAAGTGRPGAHRFHDFLICNGPGRHCIVPLGLRSLWAKIMLSR